MQQQRQWRRFDARVIVLPPGQTVVRSNGLPPPCR